MNSSVLDFQLSGSVRARIAESGLSIARFLDLAQLVKNLPYARCALPRCRAKLCNCATGTVAPPSFVWWSICLVYAAETRGVGAAAFRQFCGDICICRLNRR